MQAVLWVAVVTGVPFLVVLGVMLMQMKPVTQIELSMARCCFVVSALLLEIATIVSLFTSTLQIWIKVPSALAVSALILWLVYYLNNWAGHRAGTQRGALLLGSLNVDYDWTTEQISARLLFFNNDSITRFVLSVSFIYRPSKAAQGFQLFYSGTSDPDPLLGHVDPIRVAPHMPEIKQYSTRIPSDKFRVIGAQAGVNVAFTLPGRGHSSSSVIPVLEVGNANLTVPSLQMPQIAELPLDSISDAARVEEIITKYRASIRPEGFRAKCRAAFLRMVWLDY